MDRFVARAVGALAVLSVSALSACGGGASRVQVVPLPAIEPPVSDGLLDSPALQAVVDLQLRRDGAGLTALLGDPSAAVRARAAFGLGSVQDPGAVEPLTRLLSDADAGVRANAAFALGQLALPGGSDRLFEALLAETDLRVQARMLDALGKGANEGAMGRVVGWSGDPAVERDRVLAVARASLRGIRDPDVISFLAERLTHADPGVRMAAASYFGASQTPIAWAAHIERVRAVLDAAPLDDPIAMHLGNALVRVRDPGADRERLLRRLLEAEDWRVRATLAAALRSSPWLEDPATVDGLFQALDDPSDHVAQNAGASVGIAIWESPPDQARAAGHLSGPPTRWRGQSALVSALASLEFSELVVNWTRRMAEGGYAIAAREGIAALLGVDNPRIPDLLIELADHPDPFVRAAAIHGLTERAGGSVPVEVALEAVREALAGSDLLPMARAAVLLSAPAFVSVGGPDLLGSAYRERRADSGPEVLVPLIDAMGEPYLPLLREILDDPDYRLRRAAAARIGRITGEPVDPSRIGVPIPERPIEWGALAELGPEPRVRIETDRGVMVARLLPEQAPQTVQAFVEMVRSGEYEGVRFHRVVPNFVIQGGDVGVGDGTGGPGYRLTSEFTQLPFERGVLGMASAGKDTEGSQFFVTLSHQPQLEGSYTSFGWLESGAEVLDLVREGDRIVRMTLIP